MNVSPIKTPDWAEWKLAMAGLQRKKCDVEFCDKLAEFECTHDTEHRYLCAFHAEKWQARIDAISNTIN